MNRFALISLLVMVVATWASAQPKSDLVTAELVADVSSVKPGTPFTLGVRLHIAAGWHVYWINPGDSGLATSVHFKLPQGFKAGPLQFPVPSRLVQPGDVVNYGYENQVLILATINPPAGLKTGTDVPIAADVRWLCCKDVCLPGSAKTQITLSVGSDAKPANLKLFRKWQAEVPSRESADVESSSLAIEPNGKAQVQIHWGRAAKDVQLFPSASDAIAISDVSISDAGNASTIRFKISRLAGIELNDSAFPMVVGYTDADGNRRGLSLAVPAQSIGSAHLK